MSRSIQSSVGLSRQALEQIGILVSGLVRVTLIGITVLLLLAPWGVEFGDVLASVRSAFFGVTIAGVTLSLSTIIFGIARIRRRHGGDARAIQRWLQRRYLPHTQLDAGLRNSITTGFGYLGVDPRGDVLGLLCRPQPRQADHRRRRSLRRYRFRPAVDRQQLRLGPHPARRTRASAWATGSWWAPSRAM